MKKIIAAFDGLKYSPSTRDYAVQVAKQCSAHLVGVFLDDFTYRSYKIYELIHEKGGLMGAAPRKFEKKDEKTRAAAVADFESACRNAGISYTIHRDKNVAIHELIHESIYADALIIDGRETLSNYPEKAPTSFIRDLLSHAQCPVLVIPHIPKPITRLLLLYDGRPSSVYAIKMFSYMLPAMKTFSTEVLCVNDPKDSSHLPDNKLMKEFMKRHFPRAAYTILKGNPEITIVDYLKSQKDNPLVVLGAYRRGQVSRWFKESMADTLLKSLKLPLFIAHN